MKVSEISHLRQWYGKLPTGIQRVIFNASLYYIEHVAFNLNQSTCSIYLFWRVFLSENRCPHFGNTRYHLAVAPRKSEVVIVLDGFNDVVLPMNTAARPGDPYQTGIRYGKFYGSSFFAWLTEASSIFNILATTALHRHISEYRENIDRNDEIFEK